MQTRGEGYSLAGEAHFFLLHLRIMKLMSDLLLALLLRSIHTPYQWVAVAPPLP